MCPEYTMSCHLDTEWPLRMFVKGRVWITEAAINQLANCQGKAYEMILGLVNGVAIEAKNLHLHSWDSPQDAIYNKRSRYGFHWKSTTARHLRFVGKLYRVMFAPPSKSIPKRLVHYEPDDPISTNNHSQELFVCKRSLRHRVFPWYPCKLQVFNRRPEG